MIRHLSYLSIPADHRRVSAKKARDQVRTMFSTMLTPEQHHSLKVRLGIIEAWEHGTLQSHPHKARPQPPQLPPAPTHHTIELADGVDVDETIKG